jgi:sugar lactone lactonase YvrE
LRAKEPTNLAFGGPDGKTVFVTQRQGGFIEAFRVDRPGREFCLQTSDAAACRTPVAPARPAPRGIPK